MVPDSVEMVVVQEASLRVLDSWEGVGLCPLKQEMFSVGESERETERQKDRETETQTTYITTFAL